MLPNNPIIISNEKLSIKDECYHLEGFTTIEDDLDKEIVYKNGGRKIIAGFNHLPQINFSKLTKEEKERIGWIDVEESAELQVEKEGWGKFEGTSEQNGIKNSFKEGFKVHQSITNKMFSLDDMKKCFNSGRKYGSSINSDTRENDFFNDSIQSLQQPIQLDVEIEQTENSIKIIKLLKC